ncbi:MAG: tRNA (adenosine(37)-N6)-threonylcarbamoyltransferase complex transferase subunit TsaD [Oscillospiraceae bacterium]|nr:tRNA (adenosine(37)-N6)-threonylcarbamoyltransferase complex transferase subunit TsaD [Oscillospiraceae bacterium]MDY3065323.1 tRNA (adenosine(37)-N6)-threonylcarbamoyltransferase complex transferase subunit TsaD [Oscillospiraceae bacterium]
MKILAIESSCDETAAAVVEDGRRVLSNIVATQIAEHRLYGGVVPEIASRRHCEAIVGVTEEALSQAGLALAEVDAVAVTYAPGLIGALLVGVNFAKGLALSTGKPLIPVHHLRGHIAANYLAYPELEPPFLCLVISGGHSHIVEVKSYTDFSVIGRTRDDAAGEAYDKAARAMGYPYPGGIEIDRAAQKGKPSYKLPRPSVEDHPYDMSFSGLKTAVLNLLNQSKQKGVEVNKEDLCASFQLAVCDILSDRLMLAQEASGYRKIVLAGGVSANSGVRARIASECEKGGFTLYMPPLCYCGDNAAMIGSQAFYEYQAGHVAGLDLNAVASRAIDLG